MKKVRIGILFGGKSIEREVSLNSGRTIFDNLDNFKFTGVPIFQNSDGKLYIIPLSFLYRGKITDFEERLDGEAKKICWGQLKNFVDFVYIAQHGRFGEDGCIQGMLEILGIPYFGSKVLASAIGMNKFVQKYFLHQANIETPKTFAFIQPEETDFEKYSISFPCVVKPNHEGSSLGISLVKSNSELKAAIEKARLITPGIVQPVLVEEYIEGMEFCEIVITDYKRDKPLPLPPTEIIRNEESGIFSYKEKYMPGVALKHTPARCSIDQQRLIQETCIKVSKALGFTNMSRIDGFLTSDNKVVIIDSNSLAGMTPTSFSFLQASEADMNKTTLVNHLIETELHSLSFRENFFSDDKISQSRSQEKHKLRVAVFLGGNNNEREVSLDSGRNVCNKLSASKYKVTPVFLNKEFRLFKINHRLLGRNRTSEIEAELDKKNEVTWDMLPDLFDFVFIALHGRPGEDGSLQATLETLGVPYNGSSVLASALCIDKFKLNELYRNTGEVEVPDSHLVTKKNWDKSKDLKFISEYPVIVKPTDDGCSFFVAKVNNKDELTKALEEIFKFGKPEAMIEDFIEGIELSVGVIGNKSPRALPPSMTIAKKEILSIEEKFLPGEGENKTPAPISDEAIALVQKIAEKAFKLAQCETYARVDCFYQTKEISPTKKDRVIVLEINTIPAMTPATCLFHQAAEVGMSPTAFVDLIIKLGLERSKSSTKLDKFLLKTEQSQPQK